MDRMEKLCESLDIMLMNTTEMQKQTGDKIPQRVLNKFKGLALCHNDGYKGIFYNDDMSEYKKIQVIAHEIGHHLLHFGGNESGLIRSESTEIEADVFGAVLAALLLHRKAVTV